MLIAYESQLELLKSFTAISNMQSDVLLNGADCIENNRLQHQGSILFVCLNQHTKFIKKIKGSSFLGFFLSFYSKKSLPQFLKNIDTRTKQHQFDIIRCHLNYKDRIDRTCLFQ